MLLLIRSLVDRKNFRDTNPKTWDNIAAVKRVVFSQSFDVRKRAINRYGMQPGTDYPNHARAYFQPLCDLSFYSPYGVAWTQNLNSQIWSADPVTFNQPSRLNSLT
jgi:hypothetical protein